MAIELAGIQLKRVHHIETVEQSNFVYHRVPGMQGNVVQDLGRDSVRLQLHGIFYGETAQDSLEKLRDVYKKREAVDFLADVVGQAYFSQVIVERFEVVQSAQDPDQFSYVLTIAEIPLARQAALAPVNVDANIQAEAANFLTVATLPDALQMGAFPEITNPIEPLMGAIAPVEEALQPLNSATESLRALFNR